jgi:hypothetical protein
MTDRLALALQCATQINKDNKEVSVNTILADAEAILAWYKKHEETVPVKKRLSLDAETFAKPLPPNPNFHRPLTLSSQHNSKDSL